MSDFHISHIVFLFLEKILFSKRNVLYLFMEPLWNGQASLVLELQYNHLFLFNFVA